MNGKLCPQCGVAWPLSAGHCTCGHAFRTQFNQPATAIQTTMPVTSSMPRTRRRVDVLKVSFMVLLLALIIALWAGQQPGRQASQVQPDSEGQSESRYQSEYERDSKTGTHIYGGGHEYLNGREVIDKRDAPYVR